MKKIIFIMLLTEALACIFFVLIALLNVKSISDLKRLIIFAVIVLTFIVITACYHIIAYLEDTFGLNTNVSL